MIELIGPSMPSTNIHLYPNDKMTTISKTKALTSHRTRPRILTYSLPAGKLNPLDQRTPLSGENWPVLPQKVRNDAMADSTRLLYCPPRTKPSMAKHCMDALPRISLLIYVITNSHKIISLQYALMGPP